MCAGELRILIIGRVKTGKSILGNNIVGKTPFLVGTLRPLAGLMTTEPTEASAEISGRKIKVSTIWLFDSYVNNIRVHVTSRVCLFFVKRKQKNPLTLDIVCNLFNQSFHTCHAYTQP